MVVKEEIKIMGLRDDFEANLTLLVHFQIMRLSQSLFIDLRRIQEW